MGTTTNTYNAYNFELEFENYLQRQKVSPSTVKSYKSDAHLFLQWLDSPRGGAGSSHDEPLTPETVAEVFTVETVQQYELSLQNRHAPKATIDRRMAALSSFADFCSFQLWLPEGFSRTLVRLGYKEKQKSEESAMNSFASYLLLQGAKDSTIKNYLLDVREYIAITSSSTA